jgi:peptidyl-tRNA hydrolase, PTH1 family
VKLLVGLGNPGARHAGNRHNVGFMAVDAIADAHGFAPWRSKFNGSVAEGRLGTERALLLKPETFMNLSGGAARAAARFFKLGPEDIVVFHDELDLAPGRVRVKTGGGSAGHNGLRSLDAHLGPGFTRVRIGIGHPGDKRLVTPHVLGDFAAADRDWLEPVLAGIAEGAPALARGDSAGFLNAVGRRLAPPKAPRPPREAPPADVAEPAAGPEPEHEPEAAPEPEDARSLLQKLADRFR